MAKDYFKGITVEIGGDTSGLSKALSQVNGDIRSLQGELKAVDNALKLDPTNTELLSQKQQLLSKAVSETEKKVASLKSAKEKADKDMANGTEIPEESYRALQREIVKAQSSLKDLKTKSQDTQKALDNLGDGTQNAKEEVEELKDKLDDTSGGLGDFIGGIKKTVTSLKGFAVASAGVATVGALGSKLSELEEETREYREDLNKLDSAFKTQNKSVESARKAYNEFYQILGEEDRSVEAVNHLAELCNTEKELSDWTTICAGVTAKFGDSLPIEGLTEAANETAKVGSVTGPLADALNWAGISEDEFNEKLKACSSEQERSTLITQTLTNEYATAAESYQSMNGDIMALRESQEKLNEAKAKMGEVLTPLKATLTDYATTALTSVANAIEGVMTGTSGMSQENANLVKSVQGSITEWQNFKAVQEEKLQTDLAEIDYTKRLWEELKNLTDETGNIKEADKKRVEFIMGELSEATGVELTLTGNVIDKYGELSQTIEDLMVKKRAEIILKNQEETYSKAIAGLQEKENEQKKLGLQITEKQIEIEEIKNDTSKKSRAEVEEQYHRLRDLENQVKKLKKPYEENKGIISDYYKTISDYETTYEALISGNTEKIKQATAGIGESFKKSGEATAEELKKQAETHALYYAQLLKRVEEGDKSVTDQQLKDAETQYKQACEEYEKIGGAIPEGISKGIENAKAGVKNAASSLVTAIKEWIKTPFKINSPSKWAMEIGGFIDEGLAKGVFDNLDVVEKSFSALFGVVEDEKEDLLEEEKFYNEEKARLDNEANKTYLEGLKATAEKAKEQRQEIQNAFKEMVSDVESEISTLEGKLDNYKNGFTNNMELISTATTTFTDVNGNTESFSRYELADLSGKKAEIQAFKNNITSLKELGIDDTMLEEIKSLGYEKGSNLAEALLSATPEQRNKFISDYKEIGELSAETTNEVFKDEFEKTAGTIKQTLAELNPDLLKIGEDWGTVLGDGILNSLKTAMANFKALTGASVGFGSGIVYNTTINQEITATPQTAYETSEETRRIMENLTDSVWN